MGEVKAIVTDKKSSNSKAKPAKSSKPKKSKKVSLKSTKDATKKALKTEVDLPIPEGKGKVTKSLTKKRRIRMPQYFVDSWQELKKVTWPSRKETIKLSLAVIIFTGIFALFIALADYGLDRIVERVFL